MKLQAFFEKFEKLADTPNGVEKLRELVLRMATSGRIADQDPSDQPASELLSEIFSIRDNLIEKGEARGRVKESAITAGDMIDIPASWSRCTISEVCDLQTGATPSRQESTYFGGENPWIVSGDINKGEIFECDGRITEAGIKNSNCKIIPPNSVLIALNGQGKTRATVAILRIAAALNQSLVAMIPYSCERLLPEYLFWNLKGRYYAIRDITGQDQRRGLNMKLVGQLSLPIPPVAEQKRIVTKVDELMALCDRLEAQQQERKTRDVALARASLARFADTPIPANIDFLFHPSYDIAPVDLRKSILTLALQGKLVPQDLRDEPKVSSDEPRKNVPYDIPPNWRWVGLAELAEFINGDRSKNYPSKSYRVADGVPFINAGHLSNGDVSIDNMDYITEEHFDRLGGGKVERGDVLYCLRGSLGKCAVVSSITRGAIASSLLIIRPREMVISSFLHAYLESPLGGVMIAKYDNGSAQPNLSAANVKKYLLPLPPLAEQRRIVAKVNKLMALVDQLEMQLNASRTVGSNLMEAVVAELTETV